MIEAIVSLVYKIFRGYVIPEVKFLRGVKGQVEFLNEELEWLYRFLNDVRKKQVKDDTIRRRVLDIVDIAYDCEDVLDEFITKVHDEGMPDTLGDDQASISERWQGLFTCLENICCFLYSKAREQMHLYVIGKRIEKLKDRLNELSRRSQLYNLQNMDSLDELSRGSQLYNLQNGDDKTEGESSARASRLKTLRRTSSFQLEETNVVGREDATRTLLAQLLDKSKPQRCVISIFGIGGSGKTTLAGKLYHHPEIKNNFSHRVWVSVSQDYDTKALLRSIIYSFKEDRDMLELDMKSEAELKRYLHQSLKGKKYLVVIDDIWHKETWDCLKRAFPDENIGSRVIMTTRSKHIAKGVDDSTFPYGLRFLSPEESWRLFCMKAFNNYEMDEGLEQLGRKMVQKCGGLPLAIVVLGGLLATKKPNEWSKISNNIWKIMEDYDIKITDLFDMSFDDQPSELKVCFLYLGLFPKDQEINIEKLIRLWVAEDLISQEGDKTMEELAEEYLHQLVKKSLIQIGKIRRGRIFTCRVHNNVLQDLAKELNFVCTEHGTKNSAESSKSRRHAFYLGSNTSLLLQHCNPFSRSLLFFDQHFVKGLLPKVCRGSQAVRVIDFNNCYFENSNSLPGEIGKLLHLKYLGLSDTGILYLPSSIGKLLSLQTLDLEQFRNFRGPIELPSEIGKLTELRHLIGDFDMTLPINNLTELQTLKRVGHWVWAQVNTEKLVNLRELIIYGHQGNDVAEFIFDSIANLKSLRILSIALGYGCSFGSLEPLSNCKNLLDLNLEGKMQNLPQNLHELVPNLECLSLDGSYLEDDPMPKLEKLLNLTHLQLGFDSYCGSKMTCSTNGFPRLEILNFCPGSSFDEWEVKEGALPVLGDLKIVGHPEKMPSKWPISINTLKSSVRVHLEINTSCHL